MSARQLTENWTGIAAQLLKIGATAYGGPAIMGVMQAELQEKRQWVSKERFMDGLSLVNMLPGATAAQLSIFPGYARGGWWGGLLGGLCFVLPGFLVLMALTLDYAALGVTPLIRGALYGLGAVAALATPLGIVSILLLAGGVGLWLFHSRKLGVAVLVPLAACRTRRPRASCRSVCSSSRSAPSRSAGASR
jgi:chromate transporter